jgi:hypothetical protein
VVVGGGERMFHCAPFLFDSFSEKEIIIQHIKYLPVSRNTIKDRILKMKTNIADQLKKDIGSGKFFSICLDKIIGVTSSTRLAIIARFCSDDEIREEFVNLVTLPENTTGAEICKAVVNELTNRQLDL